MTNQTLKSVYLGLGSNIGNKIQYLKNALSEIGKIATTKVVNKSSVYKTAPIGYENQEYFYNCVLQIETSLSPSNLLENILAIEKMLGRKRLIKWGPRTIDIDILFYSNKVVNRKNLQIPHPRLHERAFVLVPFNEINPDFIHPILKKTINHLLSLIPLQELQDVEVVGTL